MDDISHFESRTGNLTCTSKEVFDFVTDIRNFERFMPHGTINNWQAERESCSFNVSMIGTVRFRLTEKEMYNKIVFTGDALRKNDFSLVLHISDNGKNPSAVKVSLNADLNPMLKMMAPKPINQFLEMLINEMESFRSWKDSKA
jgi:carbon monoxide dehydrogenase subunit G